MALLLAVLAAVAPVGMRTPPAAGASVRVPLDVPSVGEVAVDPTTGRVYVAGGDQVLAFEADGTPAGSVDGFTAALSIDLEGGSLFVADAATELVSQVDLGSLSVVETWSVGVGIFADIVIIDGSAWLYGDDPWHRPLVELDLATGAVTATTLSRDAIRLVEVPGRTDRLIAHDVGWSPFSAYDVDISGAVPTILTDVPSAGSNLLSLAFIDGSRFVTASGSPYWFTEFSYPSMQPTGHVYPATNYPSGVATTAAKGGLVVGSTRINDTVWVTPVGGDAPAVRVDLPGNAHVVSDTMAVAADGETAYVVVDDVNARPRTSLEVLDLRPVVGSVLPTQVVAEVPSQVTVGGVRLAGATSVSVGGLPGTLEVLSDDAVAVDVPLGLPPGSHDLTVTTPIGSATLPLVVVENTGAALTGTVEGDGGPLGDVEVVLTGGPLGTPRTTTTDAVGSYRFDGLAWSDEYDLALHDPSGDHVDQAVRQVVAVPNREAVLDVRLASADPLPTGGGLQAQVPLDGTARALRQHGPTGTTWVSAGSELRGFDQEARLVARILGLDGAAGITADADRVFVVAAEADTITVVDPGSTDVEATYPTAWDASGPLALAGGSLWFGSGPSSLSERIYPMDPDTGAVGAATGTSYRDVGLAEVPGAPNQLLAWQQGQTYGYIDRLDASDATLTTLASGRTNRSLPGPLGVSGADDRFWTSDGSAFALSSLEPTGTAFAGEGGASWSPVRGGMLVVGTQVHRTDAPTPVATIARGAPSGESSRSAFDQDGDRVLVATDAGALEVWGLAPTIDHLQPDAVVDDVPTEVVVRGFALGSATSVTIDGADAPIVAVDGNELRILVPGAVGAGLHDVVVTTPHGTARRALQIDPNVGASLTGRVDGADPLLAGVVLTLTGGGLSGPRTTTSGADGRFRFDGVPLGTDHRLVAVDPSGTHVAQAITNLDLTPNEVRVLDVRLSPVAATTAGPRRATVDLPEPARSLVVDPITGRAHATSAGQLWTTDAAGRLVGRTLGLHGAEGLALLGGDVFVNRGADAAIDRIDGTTLQVVDTLDTIGASNGGLAASDGRLWVTEARDLSTSSLLRFRSIDPTTRAIGPPSDTWYRDPELVAVAGADDRLLTWARTTASQLSLVDSSGDAGRHVARSDTSPREPGTVATSAALDRAWSPNGTEWSLSDLQRTGNSYPTTGAGVAHSPAHGGLLLFGTRLVQVGDPTVLGTVGLAPATGGVALAPAGDEAVIATQDGELVRWSLRPAVTSVAPTPVRPGGEASVHLHGTSLGAVTLAEVAGTPVPFDRVSDAEIVLHVPATVTAVPAGTQLSVDLHSVFGTHADAASLTVDLAAPAPPAVVWGEVVDDDVTISWTPPSDVGTSPVTTYRVSLAGDEQEVPAGTTSALFPSVPPGTWRAEVRAASADGVSEAQRSGELVVAGTAPGPPTEVALVGGPGHVRLTWEPPASAGTAPIERYEVGLTTFPWATAAPPTARALVVPDVTPGTAGALRIRAVTDHGTSPWVTSNEATATPLAPLFPDVGVDHTFYWEIWTALDQGLTTGYPDGEFHPTATTSRQAAIAFLWRAAGEPAGPYPDPGFPDVPPGHQFFAAVAWAAAEGITTGYGDGTFRPTAPVTRQAFLAFQWRAAGSPAGPFPDPGFTDVGRGHPFEDAIFWAADEGITGGYADGGFHPTAPVSRQAAVAFLTRPTWPDWQPLD